MATIVIDEELCKGCDLCIVTCPHGIIAGSGRSNSKGYRLPVLTDEGRCNACALCAIICPDLAIEVYE